MDELFENYLEVCASASFVAVVAAAEFVGAGQHWERADAGNAVEDVAPGLDASEFVVAGEDDVVDVVAAAVVVAMAVAAYDEDEQQLVAKERRTDRLPGRRL